MPNVPEPQQTVKPYVFRSMAEFEASLNRLDAERHEEIGALADPYLLLTRLERHRRDDASSRASGIGFVMRYYSRFIALASLWPAADQDALVHAAKPVFRVNVPTMRRDLGLAIAARVA